MQRQLPTSLLRLPGTVKTKLERSSENGAMASYDVLAYATTRAGWGAYLIASHREGLTWITARRAEDLFMRVIRQIRSSLNCEACPWVER